MNFIIKLLITGVVSVILSFSAKAQETSLKNIAAKYERYYAPENIKVGILVKKGQHYESERIGFPEDNTNKVFNIGSATKTFTAVLILQEMEKGNLKLSDSLGKFLNPIENIPGNVTIRQLLKHETGLGQTVGNPDVDGYGANNDNLFHESVYAGIAPQDTTKVGTYAYCNTNYMLLGELLEKINDTPYFDLLEDRILKPCGMKNSYGYISKNITDLVHPTTMEGGDVYDKINYKFFSDRVFSAGSIGSTLEDMALFYENLYERETLLTKETFNLMSDFGEGKYGLGLQKLIVGGKTYIGHGGNNDGYSYRNYYDPETGDMALYFWNRVLPFLKNSLRDDLLAYVNNQSISVFRESIISEFEPYFGDYILEGPDLKLSIGKKGEIIQMYVQGYKMPLVSLKEGVLYDGTSGINLKFQPQNPDQLLFEQGGEELVANRIKTLEKEIPIVD